MRFERTCIKNFTIRKKMQEDKEAVSNWNLGFAVLSI
jgi:hypothetical protein